MRMHVLAFPNHRAAARGFGEAALFGNQPEPPTCKSGIRRSPEMFPEIVISAFSKLRLTSIFAPFPASQVPEGLGRSPKLASTMHLVDVATSMQLKSTGQGATCVPFVPTR